MRAPRAGTSLDTVRNGRGRAVVAPSPGLRPPPRGRGFEFGTERGHPLPDGEGLDFKEPHRDRFTGGVEGGDSGVERAGGGARPSLLRPRPPDHHRFRIRRAVPAAQPAGAGTSGAGAAQLAHQQGGRPAGGEVHHRAAHPAHAVAGQHHQPRRAGGLRAADSAVPEDRRCHRVRGGAQDRRHRGGVGVRERRAQGRLDPGRRHQRRGHYAEHPHHPLGSPVPAPARDRRAGVAGGARRSVLSDGRIPAPQPATGRSRRVRVRQSPQRRRRRPQATGLEDHRRPPPRPVLPRHGHGGARVLREPRGFPGGAASLGTQAGAAGSACAAARRRSSPTRRKWKAGGMRCPTRSTAWC